MKRSLWGIPAILLLASAAQVALAGGDGQQAQRVYTYAVHIDADGRVGQVTPYGSGNDVVGHELADQVKSWLFSTDNRAQHVDGRDFRTFLRLVVAPDADGYELVSATTGPAPRQLVLPDYPAREQREGRQGTVVMKLDIGADGSVHGAEVDSVHGNVSRNMAAAARRVASQWRFAPEMVDAQPVGSTVLWPVCFLGATSIATECAWSGPEAQRYSSKMVLALDPVARRVTPLAFEER
ncbi:MAG: energy transducer TonB [Luteimonas sp.]